MDASSFPAKNPSFVGKMLFSCFVFYLPPFSHPSISIVSSSSFLSFLCFGSFCFSFRLHFIKKLRSPFSYHFVRWQHTHTHTLKERSKSACTRQKKRQRRNTLSLYNSYFSQQEAYAFYVENTINELNMLRICLSRDF